MPRRSWDPEELQGDGGYIIFRTSCIALALVGMARRQSMIGSEKRSQ